jgi:hypothetical protein
VSLPARSDPPEVAHRLRCVGVGTAHGRPTLQLLGLARLTLRLALGPPRLGEIEAPRPGDLATRVLALRRSLGVSERASSMVLGVRSRLVPFRSRLGPSLDPLSLACAADHPPGHRARSRCLGPKTVGGPPAGRSRRRGLGGSRSTRSRARKGAGPWRQTTGRYRGVLAVGGTNGVVGCSVIQARSALAAPGDPLSRNCVCTGPIGIDGLAAWR